MAKDKHEQVVPETEAQTVDAEPILGFARVIRYRSDSLGGLNIKL